MTDYIGRFAPSPTGELHLGSLVAALGSYLDARVASGKWLIRIEDVDTTRSQLRYANAIINALKAHGMESDEPILWQHKQLHAYLHNLNRLSTQVYACHCSRQQQRQHQRIGALGPIYNRHCLGKHLSKSNCALRLYLPDITARFTDRRLGICSYAFSELGDPILRRKNGDFAYALAVVVDDASQAITHVVRGEDLLPTTVLQRYIQTLLGFPSPIYLHLPLIKTADGRKLSKQNHAPKLNLDQASANLIRAANALLLDTHALSQTQTPAQILTFLQPQWRKRYPLSNQAMIEKSATLGYPLD